MKINFLLLIVFIAVGLGWNFYNNQKPLPHSLPKQALPFTYMTLTGESGALSDHKGRVTLIHFWATWCAPCLAELPSLIDLATNQENLTILAVAVRDKTTKIDRFLKKIDKILPENFIVALDPNQDISKNLYGTVKLPESFLLNRQHAFSQKIIGAEENWNSALWKQKLRSLQKSE